MIFQNGVMIKDIHNNHIHKFSKVWGLYLQIEQQIDRMTARKIEQQNDGANDK